jgi:DNA polymerase-3 subunit delta'
MRFSDIIGSAADHLRDEMQSARVVHAYLFSGPAGTGKRTLADICARALLCSSVSEKPCDVCPACKRFLSGNHPDMHRIVPEKSIRVEDIRELIDVLSIHPYEGGRHVVVIEDAEKMTPQAQNALLKTLETPPGEAVFFLLTDQMTSLLPTIISRCRIIRFSVLEENDAVSVLGKLGMEEKRARLLSRLSQGSVGRALEMNGSEQYWAVREQVIRAVNALHAKEDVGIAALSLGENKDQAETVMDVLELCARDIMVMQDSDGDVIQTDIQHMLPVDRFSGAGMLQAVMEARRRLSSNVSWQSVAEMLFFEMLDKKRF